MLRRIGLRNFKCWRELDLELAPITLLFGVNSSGKTAVLQSLLMLKQTAQSFDPGQHINFGGGGRDYVDLGSYQDLVYGHDNGTDFGLSLQWAGDGRFVFTNHDGKTLSPLLKSMSYEVDWGIADRVLIRRLRYDVESKGHPSAWIELRPHDSGEYALTSSLTDSDLEPVVVNAPKRCYGIPDKTRNGKYADRQIPFHNVEIHFSRLMHKIHYIGPLRSLPARHYLSTGGKPEVMEPDGRNAIQAQIASARGDGNLYEHVSLILQEMELVDRFEVKPIDRNERLYEATVTVAGVETSLSDVGFGVSQVLPVITMLMSAPKNSIILLEQPELHLHPNAQAALADLMLYAAETRSLQLIVESHSEHIVRRLQRRIAEANSTLATSESIKMYFCEPGAGGSTASAIDLDRFGQITNWPERFMGDVSGDLHSMAKAAIERRSQELERVGSGG